MKRVFHKFLWICLYVTPVVLGGFYLGSRFIKKALIEELNKQLNVKVDVHSVRFSGLSTFPKLGLTVTNTRIEESYSYFHQPLLTCGLLRVKFNPVQLIMGNNVIDQISISDGTVRVFSGKDGQTNFQIFIPTDSTEETTDFKINLKKIVINRFRIIYMDQENDQSANFFTDELILSGKLDSEKFRLKAKGDALFDHIKIQDSPILQGKHCSLDADVEVDRTINSYHISKADVAIEGLKASVTGDILVVGSVPDLDLNFSGRQMDIQSLLAFLPNEQRYPFREYQSNGKITLTGQIKGRIAEDLIPDFIVNFGLDDVGLFHSKKHIDIRSIRLNGKLSNMASADHEMRLHVDVHEIRSPNTSIKARIDVDDLVNPEIDYSGQGVLDLRDVSGLFDSEKSDVQKLYGAVRFNLKGKIPLEKNGEINPERLRTDGDIELKDFTLLKKDLESLEHFYASVRIKEDDLRNVSVSGKLDGDKIDFSGEAKGIISYLVSGSRMNVTGKLKAGDLNLNKWFGSDSTSDKVKEPEPVSLDIGMDLNVDVQCEKFEWTDLKAQKLFGKLRWKGSDMRVDDLKFDAWSGSSNGGFIIQKSNYGFVLSASANCRNVSIEELMKDFKNFGQAEFTDHNLKGRVNTQIETRILFDPYFNVITDSLKLFADVVIQKGVLYDYKPMESLSGFVKLNDLMNIRFDDLKNTLTIDRGIITIPKMEIRNSAMNIQLGGTHTLENYMDYKMAIRVTEILAGKSGWAKRKVEQKLEENKDGGLTAYIHMSGTPDNLKIRYDAKSAGKVLKEEVKQERKSFFQDVKKEIKGESIESSKTKKPRWDE
ncbi:MAG: hypothetical protein GC181_01230 [Bacteroidetes bacterium]|nr:hypothetical protein [Bacteroidota bacterium]